MGAVVTRPSSPAGPAGRDPARAPVRVAHVTTVDATLWMLLLGQLRGLRDEGFEVTTISAPGSQVPRLRAEGFEHVAWRNATRAWDPAADARAFVELVRIFRRNRFDVVHTHNPKPGILGRVAARLAGVPIVVNTVHGYWAAPEDPPRRRLPVMSAEWLAARFSDAELFQSAEDLAWARRLRLVAPPRARLLGSGTDLSRFDPASLDPGRLAALRAELGLPEGGLVVGMIGRMVREKGFVEFFEAARAIRARRRDVSFLVVGPTDRHKDDAISEHDRAASGEDVVFAGWRWDIPEMLGLMDVFVLPSWREGLPRSPIEAAAMGKAMVLSDIRGCREVARDEREALLVPPRDAVALTRAIERLLEDDALRASLGAAARDRALDRFDERAVARRVVETYRDLLPRPAAAPRQVDQPGLREVAIREATRADAPVIASMHRSVMNPKAFLPSLGPTFMRLLFLALIEDPAAPVHVAIREGEIVGYTAGVVSMSGFRRRFVRRYGVRAGMSVAPALLRPGVVRRAVEIFRYPEATRDLPQAEHAFLGVRQQGKGLGPILTKTTLESLEDLGVAEVKGYVQATNVPMNKMMLRVGWEPRGEITIHDGVPSVLYVYRCHSSSPSESDSR